MTLDLDALEKLADEATPGPWTQGPDNRFVPTVGSAAGRVAALCHDYISPAQTVANAAFIAGLNPATAKALIAELRRYRGSQACHVEN